MAGGLLAGGLLLAGCTTPEVTDTTPTEEEEPQDVPVELDEDAGALIDELEATRALVADLQADLATAAETSDLTELRELVADVDRRLVAEPEGGTEALFPAELAERTEERSTQDLLTVLLTAAREVGGELGRSTVEALRDPIAGDLGAWELDTPGVVGNARGAAVAATDVGGATDAVLALDGEGPRAIAWLSLAAATEDADLAREAAERATDHLEVIDIALRGLVERGGGGTPEPGEDELGPSLDDDPAAP